MRVLVRRAHLAPVLLLACGVGCKRDEPELPAPAPAPAELSIGYSRLRISLPLFVAQERGLFARHGLRVKLVQYDTAQPLLQALVEGKLDLGGYTALPISYAGMLRSGARLLFLTAMVEDREHPVSYLLRRKPAAGAAPAIRSVRDLEGKTVGILPTIAYQAWLEALLDASGVPRGSVKIQQLEPMMQGSTLAAGGVDALYTNDPAATAAIVAGVAEPVPGATALPEVLGEPLLFGSFNVRKEWADAHPAELRKLAAALDEAIDHVNQHPAEAQADLKPYLPDAFKPHIGAYPPARYLTTAAAQDQDFQRLAARYQAIGLLDRAPALDGLVYHAQPRGNR